MMTSVVGSRNYSSQSVAFEKDTCFNTEKEKPVEAFGIDTVENDEPVCDTENLTEGESALGRVSVVQ